MFFLPVEASNSKITRIKTKEKEKVKTKTKTNKKKENDKKNFTQVNKVLWLSTKVDKTDFYQYEFKKENNRV